MKYFSYKRLNKRRRFNFWLYLIGGLINLISGICTKNFFMTMFGFVMIVECLDLYNDQVSSDLINSYENMVKNMHKGFDTTIKIINKALKENDTEKLQKFSEIFDSWYKEEENDSNEGK